MGLSDRDYFHSNNSRNRNNSRRNPPMSVTVRIVIINLALWLANGLLFPDDNFLTKLLWQPANVFEHSLRWYSFLTSGFVHSWSTFEHILFNMVGLLFFGYGLAIGSGFNGVGMVRSDNVEWRLGRGEYFLFYIFAIIFSGITYAIFSPYPCLGASGGVTAVVVMFAFLFPYKTVLFMFVIPVPMWVLGFLIVGLDLWGAMANANSEVAHSAHLGGAAFAVLYYYFLFKKRRSFVGFGANIKKLIIPKRKQKPKLKINKPDDENQNTPNKYNLTEAEFEKRLDNILDRYGSVGESGLTKDEREFLQEASRKYKSKK
ncbi:MAG: rhomboid family intramembrane serine protease [Planctomycetaceae bacterium]|jgi:membrane associated rhomboid family serine protease|nr:rhomboid family intramembrane serine protease [Planctomycetaceae bacterium]